MSFADGCFGAGGASLAWAAIAPLLVVGASCSTETERETIPSLGQGGSSTSTSGGGAGAGITVAEPIYVLDVEGGLHRFNPTRTGPDAFTWVTTPDCGVGIPASRWAIHRDGAAHALFGRFSPSNPQTYECAGIYSVDPSSGACLSDALYSCDGFFTFFTMAYATAATTDDDVLYAADIVNGMLGTIDLATGDTDSLATLPFPRPALAGTPSGELWAFFPYRHPPSIHRIDPVTGDSLSGISLEQVPNADITSHPEWGLAYSDGSFYVFLTIDWSSRASTVYEVALDGTTTIHTADSGLVIVAAGSSLGAPEPP